MVYLYFLQTCGALFCKTKRQRWFEYSGSCFPPLPVKFCLTFGKLDAGLNFHLAVVCARFVDHNMNLHWKTLSCLSVVVGETNMVFIKTGNAACSL